MNKYISEAGVQVKGRIYVACPANQTSGGPDALHQLVFELNQRGFDAVIAYMFANRESDPTPEQFKFYHAPYVYFEDIENKEENILIATETFVVSLMHRYDKVGKILWWLSVDNYEAINPIGLGPLAWEINANVDFYLCQSHYVTDYIKKGGITGPIRPLSDYFNLIFLTDGNKETEKENIVLFNPIKGADFTKEITFQGSDISYIPIVNLSLEEEVALFRRAKVYIDFGNHPGKDRLPRETVSCGCCVITGRRGSANFYEDVPIADEFKFEDKLENVPQIVAKIRDCLKNYETETKKFDDYRALIKNERNKYLENLDRVFIKA